MHVRIDMVKQFEYEKQRVERTERKNIIRIKNGSIPMNDGTFKRFYLHELWNYEYFSVCCSHLCRFHCHFNVRWKDFCYSKCSRWNSSVGKKKWMRERQQLKFQKDNQYDSSSFSSINIPFSWRMRYNVSISVIHYKRVSALPK